MVVGVAGVAGVGAVGTGAIGAAVGTGLTVLLVANFTACACKAAKAEVGVVLVTIGAVDINAWARAAVTAGGLVDEVAVEAAVCVLKCDIKSSLVLKRRPQKSGPLIQLHV